MGQSRILDLYPDDAVARESQGHPYLVTQERIHYSVQDYAWAVPA